MKMSRDIAPFGLRMPAELKQQLQEQAKQNGRSLNAEIVYLLRQIQQAPDINKQTESK